MKPRALLTVSLALLSAVGVRAQSEVWLSVRPAPNAAGWNNSLVTILAHCTADVLCPAPTAVGTEGSGQIVKRTVADRGGSDIQTSLILNLDRTPPSVQIESPADGIVQSAGELQIVAHAFDALSGVASATCNGRLAQVDTDGRVTCVVPLRPGINDIVIEASDRADNSGSSGIRVTRTGRSSALRIVPESVSVLLGEREPRSFQVLDDIGNVVPNVTWRVDNPQVAEISQDGANLLTPRSPGSTTATAIAAGMSVDAKVTVYAGTRFPPGAVRWRTPPLSVIQSPETFAGRPYGSAVVADTVPERRARLRSIDERTGRIEWIETPAVDEGEAMVSLHKFTLGGALLVTEGRDGTGSTLVHGGPARDAGPWRYRSAGRLAAELVQDTRGTIGMIETAPDRFPQLLRFDGRIGLVIDRWQFPRGARVALNIACVEGADSVRDAPAAAGPLTVLPDGTMAFEILRVDDLEDFHDCGSVTGHSRRVLEAVTVTAQGVHAHKLLDFQAPAGSPVPDITMLPVVSDGHGGQLAPWASRFADGGPSASRVTHLTASGDQEYVLPVAGAVVALGNDLGAMTDGKTLVAFHLLTGEVKWTRVFPGGGARILAAPPRTLLVMYPKGSIVLDQYGQVLPQP
jgi:hypothetical protein